MIFLSCPCIFGKQKESYSFFYLYVYIKSHCILIFSIFEQSIMSVGMTKPNSLHCIATLSLIFPLHITACASICLWIEDKVWVCMDDSGERRHVIYISWLLGKSCIPSVIASFCRALISENMQWNSVATQLLFRNYCNWFQPPTLSPPLGLFLMDATWVFHPARISHR